MRKGFTLLEILLTLGILSLVLSMVYGTLIATMEANDIIEKMFATAEIGPSLAKIITEDLKSVTPIPGVKSSLRGVDGMLGSNESDSIDFISTRDAMDPEKKIRCPLSELGYSLQQSKTSSGYATLTRRRQAFFDDKPFEGGFVYEVYDKMKSLSFEYYDGEEWVDSWDEEKVGLPKAVKVTFIFVITTEETGGTGGAEAVEIEQSYSSVIQVVKE